MPPCFPALRGPGLSKQVVQDHGHFAEAEAAFLRANKPREAIDMHVHAGLWDAALAVAQAHDAAAVPDILRKQGELLAEGRKLHEAEAAFLQAKAPERAVKMFRDAGLWDDALRIARHYVPHAVQDVERARASHAQSSTPGASGTVDATIQKAKLFERQVKPRSSIVVSGA